MQYSKELNQLIEEINSKSFLWLDDHVGDTHYGDNLSKCNGRRPFDEEDCETRQGIVQVKMIDESTAVLKITLLAAGFVIGSQGSSINSIMQRTEALSTSWIISQKINDSNKGIDLRAIVIEGDTHTLLQTIQIFDKAVDRYIQLVENSSPDVIVKQCQIIDGIEFTYKPPPLRIMPQAARTALEELESSTNTIPKIQLPSSTHDSMNSPNPITPFQNQEYLSSPSSSSVFPIPPPPPTAPLPFTPPPLTPQPMPPTAPIPFTPTPLTPQPMPLAPLNQQGQIVYSVVPCSSSMSMWTPAPTPAPHQGTLGVPMYLPVMVVPTVPSGAFGNYCSQMGYNQQSMAAYQYYYPYN